MVNLFLLPNNPNCFWCDIHKDFAMENIYLFISISLGP